MDLADRVSDVRVPLDLNIFVHRYAMFYFKMSNVLADGDAYNSMWSAKGSYGKVPCTLCDNVVSEINFRSPHVVHFSYSDCAKFDLPSSEQI